MKGQIIKKYKGLATGIVTALFAIVYLIGSFSIRHSKIVSIGAEFMPKIYAFILLVLAMCLIYQGIKEAKHFNVSEENTEEHEDTKNVLLTFVLIIVYVASMELLGYMLSSALLLFLMNLLLTPVNTKRNYKMAIIYSVVLSVGTYFLFHNLMFMPLPFGIIFGG